MKKIGLISCTLILALSGCGGGGGTAADKSKPTYTLSLSASQTELPVNPVGAAPNIGGQYTASLYLMGQDNNGTPIPGGQNAFNCSIVSGLETGALYYLDGKAEHEREETIAGVTVKVPIAYRAVTLDATAGAASFHFHAGNKPGVATIRCAYQDPNGQTQSAQIDIRVGGVATGRPAQVVFSDLGQGYVLTNSSTSLRARIVDDAGQPVPPAGGNALRLRLVQQPSLQERLTGTNAAGQTVTAAQIDVGADATGLTVFGLSSGTQAGAVLIEATADRADNNVDNGLQDPVRSYVTLSVLAVPPGVTALGIATSALPGATNNFRYAELVSAQGGLPPYTWSVAGGALPSGLFLTADGIINGVPNTPPGSYPFILEVRDRTGQSVRSTLTIAVAPDSLAIALTSLPNARVGIPYAVSLQAEGGLPPYRWRLISPANATQDNRLLGTNLVLSADGVLSSGSQGVALDAGYTAGTYNFVVEAQDGRGATTRRNLSLIIQ